jgi:hypothetical protein
VPEPGWSEAVALVAAYVIAVLAMPAGISGTAAPCSILLLYLLSLYAAACRYVPGCTSDHESGCRVVPAATGPYLDIRANMEQTWATMFAQAAGTFRNILWYGCELDASPGQTLC